MGPGHVGIMGGSGELPGAGGQNLSVVTRASWGCEAVTIASAGNRLHMRIDQISKYIEDNGI